MDMNMLGFCGNYSIVPERKRRREPSTTPSLGALRQPLTLNLLASLSFQHNWNSGSSRFVEANPNPTQAAPGQAKLKSSVPPSTPRFTPAYTACVSENSGTQAARKPVCPAEQLVARDTSRSAKAQAACKPVEISHLGV
ncbi:hypothetical protein B0H11DRAFT_1902369 [Mycena galericulata]|nr:hypothetical protein B0H11DRAFT_1902369 [Mycena galericulata]